MEEVLRSPEQPSEAVLSPPAAPTPPPTLPAPNSEALESARQLRFGSSRPAAEFLVVLLIGILFSRAFAAEAYIVPTGSMAPTLLGMHREFSCRNCGRSFVLGMDESGRSGRPVCPNCGEQDVEWNAAVECNGDRLLVQKHLFDIRPPRRWEVAVFQNPIEPGQAYVKRVVALPGESILLKRGDVYIDGKIARKSLAEQHAMRIPVYDNNFLPRDVARFPRWTFRRGPGFRHVASGWKASGSHFVRSPMDDDGKERVDWIEYRHWQPERGTYGPIRDYTPYNGAELIGENRVTDLILEADICPGEDCREIVVRIGQATDMFLVGLPCSADQKPTVRRSGKPVPLTGIQDLHPCLKGFRQLEVSWVDRRLTVAVNGRLLFDPIDCDDPEPGYLPNTSPLGIGVRGGTLEVRNLNVYRDVYYTDALANAPRQPFGVGTPYKLGAGEYFVLGDNSPVSNDSRFWPGSPVVRAEMFLGKPFLVHLPSQGIPLQVFGRELYRIPDLREIRYIR